MMREYAKLVGAWLGLSVLTPGLDTVAQASP